MPEYEVDGILFLKDYYEGGYLYRDTIIFEARPPQTRDEQWVFEYTFASKRGSAPTTAKAVTGSEGHLIFEVPIRQPSPPGIRARLRVKTSYWNDWQ